MKKLFLATMTVAIALAPALAAAQSRPTESPATQNPSTQSPGTTNPSPGMPSTPSPGTSTPNPSPHGLPPNPSPSERHTTQADCERAGGKWSQVSMRCDVIR